MSRKLLESLNGSNEGNFYHWLKGFEGEPNIAWYPSAGEDFKDVIYLSKEWEHYRGEVADELGKDVIKNNVPAPDIFLHTDYLTTKPLEFLEKEMIMHNYHHQIRVTGIEELPSLELPVSPELVDVPEETPATNRVLFIQLEINSNRLDHYTVPVLYAFVEDAAFCAEKIIAEEANLSHVVRVRYGSGISNGDFLLNILKRVNCKLFVTDSTLKPGENNNDPACKVYPVLESSVRIPRFREVGVLHPQTWLEREDVTFRKVRGNR